VEEDFCLPSVSLAELQVCILLLAFLLGLNRNRCTFCVMSKWLLFINQNITESLLLPMLGVWDFQIVYKA
jgi:hypothetical protein